ELASNIKMILIKMSQLVSLQVSINNQNKMKSNRRNFLKQLSLAFGSILLAPSCNTNPAPWRLLNNEEAATFIAIAEQIIPADHDPGATDAGVVNFIDKQLTGPYNRYIDMYRNGLAAINSASTELLNNPFYNLKWEEQTAFMETMEAGKLPESHWQDINQRSFFNLLLDHSMQGFYGSPRHGGNKNYVS